MRADIDRRKQGARDPKGLTRETLVDVLESHVSAGWWRRAVWVPRLSHEDPHVSQGPLSDLGDEVTPHRLSLCLSSSPSTLLMASLPSLF